MQKNQKDFGFIGVIVIAVVLVLLAGVGWSAYQAMNKKAPTSDRPASQIPAQATSTTEYKSLTVNGYKLSYPVNENNDQVVVEDSNTPYGPQIGYAPIRSYFLSSNNKSCKDHIEGALKVDTLENLFLDSDPYGFAVGMEAKQEKVDSLVAEGKAVKQGNLYILAPSKQNEGCEELYEPTNAKLKMAIFESQEIEKNWLKSIQLAH